MVFGPINVGIHRAMVALELSHVPESLRLAERVAPRGVRTRRQGPLEP
jgi:hypothetical protein